MSVKSILFCVLALFALPVSLGAQGSGVTVTPLSSQLNLGASIGNARSLGYKFPSTDFNVDGVFPIKGRVELSAGATYSPDHKYLTNDGNQLGVGATAVLWPTHRFGLEYSYDYSWLWTSQFSKSGRNFTPAVVIHDSLDGQPGRLYVGYILPSGCVWATSSNPCTIQSGRLQGVSVGQTVQMSPRTAFSISTDVVHFCDQSNPNAPSIPRTCHIGGDMYISLWFRFSRAPAYGAR